MRVQTWAEFSAAVKRGATAGRLAGTITAKQERKTRTGNKMGVVQFSDASGQYEAVLFSEGAGAVSRHAGARQVGGRSPSRPRTGRKASTCASRRWSRSSKLASKVQKALRIFLRDAGPVGTLAGQLAVEGRGAGELRRDQGRRAGRGRDRAARPLCGVAARRLGDAGRFRAWSRWSWCETATVPRRSRARVGEERQYRSSVTRISRNEVASADCS